MKKEVTIKDIAKELGIQDVYKRQGLLRPLNMWDKDEVEMPSFSANSTLERPSFCMI